MKAIHTKYIGPSLVKGSRIKAYTGDQSITLSYGHGSSEREHLKAALALIAKMNWKAKYLAVAHGKHGNTYAMLEDLDFEPVHMADGNSCLIKL